MQIPQDLFTWASLATLAGASVAVMVVTNVLGHFFNPPAFPKFRPFLPLVVSLAISFGGASYFNALNGWSDWILAFLNGCLICAAAVGINDTIAVVSNKKVTLPWIPAG